MERGRRSSGAGKAESAAPAVVLKKGPWTAEEDEVLMEYVHKHGPRDWSCIRTQGLLPRSGKSCRLRWVNKLKPDLKTGCKFSTEEERTVIELQARFGNKWARIATYLPGRTDNDVKNFWSTRQKRLARMLQQSTAPPPAPASQKKKRTSQQQKNRGTDSHGQQRMAPIVPPNLSIFDQECSIPQNAAATLPCVVIPEYPYPPIGECSSSRPLVNQHCGFLTSTPEFWEIEESQLNNPQQLIPIDTMDHKTDVVDLRHGCLLDMQLTQFPFNDLPNSLLDLPLVPEDHPLSLEFDDVDGFLEESFTKQEVSMDPLCDEPFSGDTPSVKVEQDREGPIGGGGNIMDDSILDTSDSCFDDFPVEMLNFPDELPPPS